MRTTFMTLAFILSACDDTIKDTSETTETTKTTEKTDVDEDGYSEEDGDCNDNDASVNPGVSEIPYDSVDNDCNNETPDDDIDGDGYPIAEDCDDGNSDISPAAQEVCDLDMIDEDCDGLINEDDNNVTGLSTWYKDNDNDGFGDQLIEACQQPEGSVDIDGDCNDNDSSINPNAQEICDNLDVDENCDGLSDDFDSSTDPSTMSTFYPDNDLDGYGGTELSVLACDAENMVTNNTDCNDQNANINPGVYEICDELDIDEDCNGVADNDDSSAKNRSVFYSDTDNDGYGDPSTKVFACDIYEGLTTDNTDCDDTLDNVHPGAEEIPCSGMLESCTGEEGDYCVDDLSEGDLVISEVMFNPATCSDASCEWIEIYNNSTGSVDLIDLKIENSSGSSANVIDSTIVQSGDYSVLAVGGTGWSYSDFTPDGTYNSGLLFNNILDSATISNSTIVIDSTAVLKPTNGYSWEGLLSATDNDTESNWSLSENELADGDFGTPGDKKGLSIGYEGYEQFEYAYGAYGDREMVLYWDTSGTPLTPCSDCEWVFDVTLTYNIAESTDPKHYGSDTSYIYAYIEDYYGYSVLAIGYSGAYYPWCLASFVGDTFTYSYGWNDYPYGGYYYTNYYKGEATVKY